MKKRPDTLNTDTTASTNCIHTTGAIVSLLSAQPAQRTPAKEAMQTEQQNQFTDGLTLTLATLLCCTAQPGTAYLTCIAGNAYKRLNAARTHLPYKNRPQTMSEACQPAYSVAGVVNTTACCWSSCAVPAAASTLLTDSTQQAPYLLPMGVNAASMASNFYPTPSTAIPEAVITHFKPHTL